MYSDIIQQIEKTAVKQRNDLRYKYFKPVEDIIHNSSKLEAIVLLKYLLHLRLAKLSIIYDAVKLGNKTLNEAMQIAEV